MVVGFSEDDRAIGVEIPAPSRVSLSAINQVLEKIGQAPVTQDELAPVSGRP